MPFAAIQAIGNMLLLLPVRTCFLLKTQRIAEVGKVLEFINTDYKFQLLFYGNRFGQI